VRMSFKFSCALYRVGGPAPSALIVKS